ncbi:hypothetical protein [Jiangella anatolica]|nr:hypothetical protein [Jiangella anatolica]
MTRPRVAGAVRRDDTIQRLGGQGDNWYSTWAGDGSLYVALCDGSGFPGLVRKNYNSRLYRVDGHPGTSSVSFHDVPGYPDLSTPLDEPFEVATPPTRYYGFGTLAVDDTIYQYLSTWNLPTTEEHMESGELRFIGAKLIYSADGGTTWRNQDGSTPVHWEDWDERSSRNMVFLNEPGETFSLFSILQMGQGYRLNTDGYVYVYAPNGNTEGTMNQLVMFRVPVDSILDRGRYEYFVEAKPDGSAAWSPNIEDRGIVHTFPAGWVNTKAHAYAWQPSITYDPGLDLYLMANWATGPAPDGDWFGKPSYLGLYQSETPWGPWEQFHEETSWTPGGDEEARCYQPQIVPNWIADDGRSFWLVWTDFQSPYTLAESMARMREIRASDASPDDKAAESAALRPYYAFNVQLVELDVTG